MTPAPLSQNTVTRRRAPMPNRRPEDDTKAARKKPVQMNLRVSETARDLLGRLADHYGLNLTHALEFAIREAARNAGVWDITPPSQKGRKKS